MTFLTENTPKTNVPAVCSAHTRIALCHKHHLPHIKCRYKHCSSCGFCQHTHSASRRAAIAAVAAAAAIAAVAVAVVEVAAMVTAVATVAGVDRAAVVAAVAVAVVAVSAIDDHPRYDKLWISEPMTTEIDDRDRTCSA